MIARDLPNDLILKEIGRKPVAIIPVGSTEQHGPHLPVSTDSDIVTYIARKVSESTGFLLLPTIECGVSTEHHPFFNVSSSPRALREYLVEICLSLRKNGIKAVIILNGHHGNQVALKGVTSSAAGRKGAPKVFVYHYWHFMKSRFDHAGLVETSIMLAISSRVEMKRAEKGLVEADHTKKELERLGRMANKSFILATGNGVWGDPRRATAGKGRKIIAEAVAAIVRESQTCLTGKSQKTHQ